ncbi:MAG: hypothetical protein AABZ57_03100, partial [Candidatus Margulisiibacteriota bacterium]
ERNIKKLSNNYLDAKLDVKGFTWREFYRDQYPLEAFDYFNAGCASLGLSLVAGMGTLAYKTATAGFDGGRGLLWGLGVFAAGALILPVAAAIGDGAKYAAWQTRRLYTFAPRRSKDQYSLLRSFSMAESGVWDYDNVVNTLNAVPRSNKLVERYFHSLSAKKQRELGESIFRRVSKDPTERGLSHFAAEFVSSPNVDYEARRALFESGNKINLLSEDTVIEDPGVPLDMKIQLITDGRVRSHFGAKRLAGSFTYKDPRELEFVRTALSKLGAFKNDFGGMDKVPYGIKKQMVMEGRLGYLPISLQRQMLEDEELSVGQTIELIKQGHLTESGLIRGFAEREEAKGIFETDPLLKKYMLPVCQDSGYFVPCSGENRI